MRRTAVANFFRAFAYQQQLLLFIAAAKHGSGQLVAVARAVLCGRQTALAATSSAPLWCEQWTTFGQAPAIGSAIVWCGCATFVARVLELIGCSTCCLRTPSWVLTACFCSDAPASLLCGLYCDGQKACCAWLLAWAILLVALLIVCQPCPTTARHAGMYGKYAGITVLRGLFVRWHGSG